MRPPTSPMALSRPRLIYLVGFMGAGKSSVGARLATALSWPFVDLDTTIEAGQGLTIRQIFEQAGEPFFRAIERAALAEVIKVEPAVIALGGGTFVQPPNLELIQARGGPTIWLECSPDELHRRCQGITNRPLFRDRASFDQLLQQRLPYYQLAEYRISTEGHSAEDVAEQILRLQLF
ncbi:MAG TPA: shikimate kinase [Terriglobia bacterium]|jgi:shikimate kinase|nr:shikimate kinase [Terriglobia bacterium]